MKAANTYMIGADPEFGILNGDVLVNTQYALPHGGKIGWDHSGNVVEIRPNPHHLASRVCADIFRQLCRRELQPFRRYKWKSGAMAGGQPIGGHIHFDVPYPYPQLHALDRMSEWFQMLELFDRGETAIRRYNGYGGFSEARGSGRRTDGFARLEYRTPPSWLSSPELAHLTLTAFKLALVEPQHTLDTLQTPDIQPATKLRRFIAGFGDHDDDAEELAPKLRNLNPFRADPTLDFKLAWGIPAVESEAATSEFTTSE